MIWKTAETPRSELDENRACREKKREEYLRYGLDREGMIRFVVDAAEPLPDRVLDIGTGKGYTAVEIARRGSSVISVDKSEEMLRETWIHAVDTGVEERVELHLENGGDLPFEAGSFEAVTMTNVLHHLENPEEVLAEIARVLVPGGRLIVSDFTDRGFDILEEMHRREGRGHDRDTGETMDGFAARLGEAGMKCIERDRRYHQHLMVAEKNGVI